ncbi:hypothetical protein CBR_g236 [Chara braunii]|uniref:Uncharacterized protein n=1 Tax=Chara braunii TaxID=69332 RepID=A0A388JLZ5_CHABU|nr:hypothetical protein CBR_g236 [Chara braunii]|eukprot:GBG58836.1 hypothetical protein CBR_g236 [Chara braunii]
MLPSGDDSALLPLVDPFDLPSSEESKLMLHHDLLERMVHEACQYSDQMTVDQLWVVHLVGALEADLHMLESELRSSCCSAGVTMLPSGDDSALPPLADPFNLPSSEESTLMLRCDLLERMVHAASQYSDRITVDQLWGVHLVGALEADLHMLESELRDAAYAVPILTKFVKCYVLVGVLQSAFALSLARIGAAFLAALQDLLSSQARLREETLPAGSRLGDLQIAGNAGICLCYT